MSVSLSGAVVGDRVVVRYLLGEATPADWRGNSDAAQSDVTGVLLDDGDPLRLERDGDVVSIPHAAVTSVRLLSARPVRNSEIRTLEHVGARSWPGVDTTWIEGWFCRAGRGFSRRANSALPLEMSARADLETLQRIARWYAEHDLPPLLALPDRLMKASTISGVEDIEVQALTCDLASLAEALSETSSAAVVLTDVPAPDWLVAYAGTRTTDDTEAVRAVVTAGEGPPVFARIDADPPGDAPASIGRGVVTEATDGRKWLGLTALWTDPRRRGEGLSTQVLKALVTWGLENGAESAYLQVETTNRLAGSWYRRLGFGLHHTYRYLTPDIPTDPAGNR
ncbi:N-acetylglutamate synthase, CG3035 family [Gordonia aurantiaca]|uniref:N-acetylglutamate synthase, CG3035 family n=1 Tax=Gordonia sp. B21 TaxID=3151852 RepID=UPI00326341BA